MKLLVVSLIDTEPASLVGYVSVSKAVSDIDSPPVSDETIVLNIADESDIDTLAVSVVETVR